MDKIYIKIHFIFKIKKKIDNKLFINKKSP